MAIHPEILRPPYQEALYVALAARPATDLVNEASIQMLNTQITRKESHTDVSGVIEHPFRTLHEVDSVRREKVVVRISDSDIVSTNPEILATLVKNGEAKQVVFSFAYSPSTQLRDVMGNPGRDISGYRVMGVALREGDDDYFAYEAERSATRRALNPLALLLIDEEGFKMLTVMISRNRKPGRGISTLDWDGRVLVESDEPIAGVEAIDRYERVKRAFGIGLVTFNERKLRSNGFSLGLRKLYRRNNELLLRTA